MSKEKKEIHHPYKFKLKPTEDQLNKIRQFAGTRRWVWNNMKEERQKYYEYTGKSLSASKQMKRLTDLKKAPETDWLSDMHAQALQQSIRDLDDAYKKFYEEDAGFPRFKSKHNTHQTFQIPQGIKLDGCHIRIPKIGWVQFWKSREVEGELKSITVKRQTDGWFVVINTLQEIEVEYPEEISEDDVVGIDLGLMDLATLSDGEKIDNPRYFRGLEKELSRAQKKLSRKQYLSNNWKKQKAKVDKIHAKIRNKRRDLLHKLSTRLVDENQAICLEDLCVEGLAKSRLSKSVNDAGWSKFVDFLRYKCEWSGTYFVQVDRWFPSSRLCRECGVINEDLELSDREWTCECGKHYDRDVHGAENIKHEGIRIMTGSAGHTAGDNNQASGGGTAGNTDEFGVVKVLPMNEEPGQETNHSEGFG